MTAWFEHLAEARIQEAIANGVLDDLPDRGRRIDLTDYMRVPAELRAPYALLAGQGLLPEALELRKEALRLADLLQACTDDHRAEQLSADLRRVRHRLQWLRERQPGSAVVEEYRDAVARRLC